MLSSLSFRESVKPEASFPITRTLGLRVNRGMKKGRDVIGPGSRPFFLRQYCVVCARPFLALLLLLASSSQEVARDPGYRSRGPAYRIRHPA